MKDMPRLEVSLVSETGMFWWTPSVPISGGLPTTRLKDRQCLARASSSSCWCWWRSGVWVFLKGWICYKLFLTPSSLWILQIWHLLPIRLPVSLPFLQIEGGETALGRSGLLWGHWPIEYVSSFSEEDCSRSRRGSGLAHGSGLGLVFRHFFFSVASLFFAGDGQFHPNFEKSAQSI